jgi:hypothetical protein
LSTTQTTAELTTTTRTLGTRYKPKRFLQICHHNISNYKLLQSEYFNKYY